LTLYLTGNKLNCIIEGGGEKAGVLNIGRRHPLLIECELTGSINTEPASKEMKELKERNKLIRQLYKPGLGGTLGKQFGDISRQRIHQIVHKKRQNIVWRWFKRYIQLYVDYYWGRR